MKAATEELVADWWAALFDVDRADLWRGVTARPHRLLGDYPGWFVAWRGAGVHVSVPAGPHDGLMEAVAAESPYRLQRPSYWHAFADRQQLRVIGPGTQLDRDPAPSSEVGRRLGFEPWCTQLVIR